MAPNITMSISCNAWNGPVVYPSCEYQFDIKESHGNMPNTIFQKEAQGVFQEHLWALNSKSS